MMSPVGPWINCESELTSTLILSPPPSEKPSMVTLSSTSNTCLYKWPNFFAVKSNMCGLVWFPMAKTSAKPLVVTKQTLAPFLSSKALVATVVPIRILSMESKLSLLLLGIALP